MCLLKVMVGLDAFHKSLWGVTCDKVGVTSFYQVLPCMTACAFLLGVKGYNCMVGGRA